MKIIHCSDLHLDSSLSANLGAEKSRIRRKEIQGAFKRLADCASELGADAVMICGDMFDTANTSQKTVRYVLDVIAEHAKTDFLYLHGNHDGPDILSPNSENASSIPPNLKFFSEKEWTYYRYRDGTVICGTESEAPDRYDKLTLDAADTNIVMLHGQISAYGEARNKEAALPKETTASAESDTVHLKELANKNIDYLALGHIHTYDDGKIYEKDGESGVWCYCGCPEGRGFDECGEKGFVFVETENKKVKHTFVRFSRRTLETVRVDISGLVTSREIESACEAALAGLSRDCMVKLILTGTYTVDTQKDTDNIRANVLGGFFFGKVYDRTTLKIDPEDYKNDISLKGEFIRKVLESDMDQDKKDRVIMCGLLALKGEDIGQ